jgi:CRISPR-associated protein Cas2
MEDRTVRILVTYDVSTETPEGRRRLRRVAKVCKNYGQRVQKSVFECEVDDKTQLLLEHQLLAEIDVDEDNLRLYRLREPVELYVKQFGSFQPIDFEGPLVV